LVNQGRLHASFSLKNEGMVFIFKVDLGGLLLLSRHPWLSKQIITSLGKKLIKGR